MKFDELVGASSDISALPTIMKNFSVGAPVEVKEVPTTINFSENPVGAVDDYINKCFSLIERIKLAKMTPRQVLRRRLNEVVRYVKANDVSKVKSNKRIIIRYISEYVYQTIMNILNDPSVSKINLILILGLSSILGSVSTTESLQLILRKAKAELESSGSITKTTQNKLSKTYAKFWTEFLFAIEEKYFPEDKKGVLVRREKGLIVQ
jgi:hypothetical protein